MGDKVKIKVYVGTGFAGCTHEDVEYVDRAEWEAMTEEEQEAYLEEAASTFLHNCIEHSAWVDDEEET